MEVDEIEAGLLEKFSSLQTVDQPELIRQMRRLVGGEDVLSETSAVFYLEMSNWNVASAVGHYFDLQASNGIRLPSMSFVRDVTIGEGESVPPCTAFTKTWTVQNTGSEPWPAGCHLRFTQGHKLDSEIDRLPVGCLGPWQETDLSLRMRSPQEPGIYESQWRMATHGGDFFGDIIWVILTVEPTGTLALTQQLNNFHALGGSSVATSTTTTSSTARSSLGACTDVSTAINPFGLGRPHLRPSSPTDLLNDRFISPRHLLTRNSNNASSDTVMEQEDEMG